MILNRKKPSGSNRWAFVFRRDDRVPYGTNGSALDVLPEAGM